MDIRAGRLTAVARTIDLDVPSNRAAVMAAAVATLAGTVITLATSDTATLLTALGRGVAYGVGTFLAWAVARELHPDEPRAAQLAILAYAPAAFLGPPALAATFALLLAARIVVRSTGRRPTPLDLGGFVVLAGVAATSAVGLAPALALAWAVHVDRRLPRPADDTRHEVAAIATAATALASTVVTDGFVTDWRLPGVFGVIWLAIAVAAVTRLRRPTHLESTGDASHHPLEPVRVQHARWLVVAAATAAVVWAGAAALAGLAPAVAGIVGTALAAPRLLTARDTGTPVEPPTGPA